MEAIWQWGIELIRTIQLVHGPALDAFFKAITFLGDEEFYLILLPVIFWCVDPVLGIRLVTLFLFSAYANAGVKDLIGHPRPFALAADVRLHDAEGYGFPSGHSQSAVVVWGMIAASFRKTWLWIAAILLAFLIGFSRVYLGVHFPTDLLGGWTLGVILLALYLWLLPHAEAWLKRIGLVWQLVLVIVVPLALVLIHPANDTISTMAVMTGMGVGVALVAHLAPFKADGPFWQRAARFLVGAIVLLLIYFGLKMAFPGPGEPLYAVLRWVRFVLLGLWSGLGAPWLFHRLRLVSAPKS